MPRIEKFKIMDFDGDPEQMAFDVTVPTEGVFLNKVMTLHDGIYAFYSVSEIIVGGLKQERFYVVKGKGAIPERATLVDILSVILEIPPEMQKTEHDISTGAEPSQGILLFPIYKAN